MAPCSTSLRIASIASGSTTTSSSPVPVTSTSDIAPCTIARVFAPSRARSRSLDGLLGRDAVYTWASHWLAEDQTPPDKPHVYPSTWTSY